MHVEITIETESEDHNAKVIDVGKLASVNESKFRRSRFTGSKKKPKKIIISPYEENLFISQGWTNYQIGLASKDTQARRRLRAMHATGLLSSRGQARSGSPTSSRYGQSRRGTSRPTSAHPSAAQHTPFSKRKMMQFIKDSEDRLRMSVPMPGSQAQYRVAPLQLRESGSREM